MTKSIMELTDQILGSDFRMDPDETTNPEELPEMTDEVRTILINESSIVPKGDPPAPSIYDNDDEREQHQAGGPSRQKKKRDRAEAEANKQSLRKNPQQTVKPTGRHTITASLYPRITLKGESREYRGRDAGGRVKDVFGQGSSPHGTPSTSASREAGAAAFAKRKEARDAARSASIKTSNDARAADDAKRKAGQTKDPSTGKPLSSSLSRSGYPLSEKKKKDDDWIQGAEDDIERRGTKGKCTPITKKGCTGKAKALAKTFKRMDKKKEAENASISREQYAVLKEALKILKEVTGVGSVGVVSGGKAYDDHGPAMGKDTPKIKGVDSSLKKMNRKGGKKKVVGKKGSKGKKMENSSFLKFLDTVISETLEG